MSLNERSIVAAFGKRCSDWSMRAMPQLRKRRSCTRGQQRDSMMASVEDEDDDPGPDPGPDPGADPGPEPGAKELPLARMPGCSYPGSTMGIKV